MIFLSIEAVLLVIALSLDTLTACFGFGAEKIKVPFSSAVLLNIICSLFLGISIVLSGFFRAYLDPNFIVWLSFSILFILGVFRLLDMFIKKHIKTCRLACENEKSGYCGLLLNVYADLIKADSNKSKSLSLSEAFTLAVALSVDSLGAGFGIGMLHVKALPLVILTFLLGMLAVWVGGLCGSMLAKKTSVDLSWVGGIVLILLAFLRIL